MEVVEDSLEVVTLIDGSQGSEGDCICLDEKKKNQESVVVDEPSSILMNSKIDQAHKEIQQNSQELLQITEAIKTKEAGRSQLMSLLDLLNDRGKVLRGMEHEKMWVDHLDQAMAKFHAHIYARPQKGSGLCSSEEELNNLIRSLHYRMQHGKRRLVEVKHLHEEIKQLEETRETVRANDFEMDRDFYKERDRIYDNFKFGRSQHFRYQVMYMGLDLDTIRKKKQSLSRRIEYAKKLKQSIDVEISSLQAQLTSTKQKKTAAYERFLELKKLSDKRNGNYYKLYALLNNERALATTNNVADLEKLSSSQDRDPNFFLSILEGKNQESETDWAKFMEVIRREDELFKAKLDLQMKKQVLDKSARKKIVWYQNVAEEKLREYEKNLKRKKVFIKLHVPRTCSPLDLTPG